METWQLPFLFPPAQSRPSLKFSPFSSTFARHSLSSKIGTWQEFKATVLAISYMINRAKKTFESTLSDLGQQTLGKTALEQQAHGQQNPLATRPWVTKALGKHKVTECLKALNWNWEMAQTSTSLRTSEVKLVSVSPQPWGSNVLKNAVNWKIKEPAIIPCDPAKVWPSNGKHTGGNSDRSTCSPWTNSSYLWF